jgi:hypothetical protein
LSDAATIVINLMKEQGRVCDDCGNPGIQACSTSLLIPSGDEPPPFAPGKYVQKCYCGSCFIKRLSTPKSLEVYEHECETP